MRRGEALTLAAAALVLTVAGLVWLTGPWGLLGAGLALLAVTVFVVDLREE